MTNFGIYITYILYSTLLILGKNYETYNFLILFFISMHVHAGQKLSYSYNNEMFEGYLSQPETQSKGLIIVIHDWDGLTEYEETRVKMLSSLGYTAFAVDLYGKGNRPKEINLRKRRPKIIRKP